MKASVLDVISAILLFLGGSFSLGYILTSFLFKKQDIRKSLFGNMIIGFSLYYTLVLCQINLSLFSTIFSIAILVASILLFITLKQKKVFKLRSNTYINIGFSVFFIGICLWISHALIERIFFEPIFQWDARINWFLYAKKLFYGDGLHQNTYYYYPTAQSLAHPGYPKLIPTISAFFVKYIGFWNDHLPKTSLFIFLCGVIIALLSAKHIHWVWKIAFFILLVGFSPYIQSTTGGNTFFITIGYMDGWLSIYTALTLLFLLLYTRYLYKEYLFNGITGLLLLPTIKNEGMLIMLLIVSGYILSLLFFHFANKKYLKLNLLRLVKLFPIILILVTPIIIWKIYLKKWGIDSTDYAINFSDFFKPSLYNDIFASNKLSLIKKEYIDRVFTVNYWYTFFLLLFSALIFLFLMKISNKSWRMFLSMLFLPVYCGLTFILAMIVVFCLVPLSDLQPYLLTGADRAGLHSYYMSGISLVSLCMVFYFSPFKKQEMVRKQAPQTPINKNVIGTVRKSSNKKNNR